MSPRQSGSSQQYRPPPTEVCEVVESQMSLGIAGTDRMFLRQNVYKGRVVDFCYIQEARQSADEDWVEIYRIDTAHGSVHEHRHYSDGSRREIEVLPKGEHNSWEIVTRLAGQVFDKFLDMWQERRREWVK